MTDIRNPEWWEAANMWFGLALVASVWLAARPSSISCLPWYWPAALKGDQP